jgi:hypothetical protein
MPRSFVFFRAESVRLFYEHEQAIERGQIVIRDELEPVGSSEFLHCVHVPQS